MDRKIWSGPIEIRRLLGVNVSVMEQKQAASLLVRNLRQRKKTKAAFSNSNLLVQLQRCSRGPELLDDFIVLNDGLAVDIGSKLLYGRGFPENLNGSDLISMFFEMAPPGTRVFLLGSRPDVVADAANLLERKFRVKTVGFVDGYRPDSENDAILQKIALAEPEIIVVALGNPKQEIWIADHAERVPASLLIGAGAWMDFFTGRKVRAPIFVRALRCEWVVRLLQEPWRMWRRYSLDIIFFFALSQKTCGDAIDARSSALRFA